MIEDSQINKILMEWGRELEDDLKNKIVSLKIGVTGKLKNSINTQVTNKEVLLKFLWYGRMVDMGAGRKITGETIVSNSEAFEIASGRKPKKWYSPMAYGMLSVLAERIRYQAGDDAMRMLKEELTTDKPTT